METTQQYEKVFPLIVKKFIKIHGGNEEDLLSVCHESYIVACQTYDPNKAKLRTWVYNNMWWAMQTYNRNKKRRLKKQEIINFEQLPQKEYNHKPLSELYAILTDDAKCICEVLLDLSPELLQSFKDSGSYIYKTRDAIRDLFLDIGWPGYRIKNAFRDLYKGLTA